MKPFSPTAPFAPLLVLLLTTGCTATRTTQTSDRNIRHQTQKTDVRTRNDSLVRQTARQLRQADTTTVRKVLVTEPLPADRTLLAIPLEDMVRLPPGAAYTARSGRAEVRAERHGDTLLVSGRSDSTYRRTWLLESRTTRKQMQTDNLAAQVARHETQSAASYGTTDIQTEHVASEKTRRPALRPFLTGLLLGGALAILSRHLRLK